MAGITTAVAIINNNANTKHRLKLTHVTICICVHISIYTFHFNGRYFSQKQGVAMGTKMGPSVACIFM